MSSAKLRQCPTEAAVDGDLSEISAWNEGNTGAAEPSATNPERKSHWASG